MTLTKLTQADVDAAAKATKIAALQAQFAVLDKEVSRSAENMYRQGIYTSISEREKTAITEKEKLREQISQLQ